MVSPREHLQHLEPYELPGSSAGHGDGLLQLAQNESYLGASPKALEAARQACRKAGFYPDPDATGLRSAIADAYDIAAGRVVCARGAMELISLLANVYLAPGAGAVVSQYGYLYFRNAIELAGARVITAPEPGLVVDVDAVADSVDGTTRLVYLANPGNPTGSHVSKAELETLRRRLPDSVLLVIDEAYAEFVDPGRYQACFDLVEEGATAVLRTFSKIHGLAGLRVGWGYFPQAVTDLLRVVQQPNGVTGPAQAAATASMLDPAHVEARRRSMAEVRGAFIHGLRNLGFDPLASQGNFVLVRFRPGEAGDVQRHLFDNKILVREMSGYALPEYLRITLGTDAQMRQVLRALENWRDGH